MAFVQSSDMSRCSQRADFLTSLQHAYRRENRQFPRKINIDAKRPPSSLQAWLRGAMHADLN